MQYLLHDLQLQDSNFGDDWFVETIWTRRINFFACRFPKTLQLVRQGILSRKSKVKESTKGIIAIILACTIWGLSGLYYKLLSHVPPLEVLAHRTLWSTVFFGSVIILNGRLSEVKQVFSDHRALGVLAISAIMIRWTGLGLFFPYKSVGPLRQAWGTIYFRW